MTAATSSTTRGCASTATASSASAPVTAGGDAAAETVVDAGAVAGAGALLIPGFIDIHGHGGGGASYDDGPDAIRAARALHRAHGTTRAVVSLVTAPLETLERRAAMVADLVATDADILGSHLEGPFLDPAHKGAHDESLLRDAPPRRRRATARGRARHRPPGDARARAARRARRDPAGRRARAPPPPSATPARTTPRARRRSTPARRSSRTRSTRCRACTIAIPGRSGPRQPTPA